MEYSNIYLTKNMKIKVLSNRLNSFNQKKLTIELIFPILFFVLSWLVLYTTGCRNLRRASK